MTAQKPRVYVMESQSFNLTPPPRLFLTEVRCEGKFMQIFLYKRTVLLEWRCGEKGCGIYPTRKKEILQESRADIKKPNLALTETLQWGTKRNENWGCRNLTSPNKLVYTRNQVDLIRQCVVLLGLSLQQSVHRMHPPLAFDAVQIHPPLLRVMN